MFGLGFGELCVIIIVALVVIGPRDLPKVMRKAGQWAGKARRMAAEMRAQSGIDDILQDSSIGDDLQEIRKLARGELDGVAKAVSGAVSIKEMAPSPSANSPTQTAHVSASHFRDDPYESSDVAIAREREYPRDGADSYRALPDTALAYSDGFPSSAFANDPLYADGDIDAPKRKSLPPLETPEIKDYHDGLEPPVDDNVKPVAEEKPNDEAKPEAAP
jgi:sec-independent protein translocase protein TatB